MRGSIQYFLARMYVNTNRKLMKVWWKIEQKVLENPPSQWFILTTESFITVIEENGDESNKHVEARYHKSSCLKREFPNGHISPVHSLLCFRTSFFPPSHLWTTWILRRKCAKLLRTKKFIMLEKYLLPYKVVFWNLLFKRSYCFWKRKTLKVQHFEELQLSSNMLY